MLAGCSRRDVRTSNESLGSDTVRHAATKLNCARAAEIAVLDRRVDLALTGSSPALRGHGDVKLRALAPASAIQLDSPGLHVYSASSNEQALHFEQEAGRACFELLQPLAAGEELTLALTWQVEARARGNSAFSPDLIWVGYSQATWLPTKLDPGQRATLTLAGERAPTRCTTADVTHP